MEGYLRAAQISTVGKQSRLKELLSSTDTCLRQLSRRLAIMPGQPDAASKAAPGTDEASPGLQSSPLHQAYGLSRMHVMVLQQPRACCSSWQCKAVLRAGDILALRESSLQWNHMSASLQAEIPTQPAMLKGGSLRDYQMAVSPSAGVLHLDRCYCSSCLTLPCSLSTPRQDRQCWVTWDKCLQGLRWMVGLHDHQLNGILADEMVGCCLFIAPGCKVEYCCDVEPCANAACQQV